MKTLKWFSFTSFYDEFVKSNRICVYTEHHFAEFKELAIVVNTEQQAFDWLEANGYIERIKENG